MFDSSTAGAMLAEIGLRSGENRLAYVKAIRSEDVAFLCARLRCWLQEQQVFVLHAADDPPIFLTDSREFRHRGCSEPPHRNRQCALKLRCTCRRHCQHGVERFGVAGSCAVCG